ncbi:hypothetical protein AN944_04197 [Shewanella sp. P1-14-1]|nr:hypothetical protein AN944_04197 [Shewanella sp. P1-14-1]
MGSAYATKNFTVRRIAGLILGKLLGKLAKDPDIIKDPQRLSSAIAMIVKNIKNQSSKEFRSYVFKRVFIIAAVKLVKVARNTFKEMLKGTGDQRVRAPLLLGSIVYLEQE